MIFVTVGSTSFDELIMKVDELIETKFIKDEVIAQIGRGEYIPKYMKWFRFAKSLDSYIAQADLIITHGGAGTLYEILHFKKRAVAIMNPKAINNREFPEEMHRRHMIILCENLENLEKCILKALSSKFKMYVPPRCEIHKVITQYLDQLEILKIGTWLN